MSTNMETLKKVKEFKGTYEQFLIDLKLGNTIVLDRSNPEIDACWNFFYSARFQRLLAMKYLEQKKLPEHLCVSYDPSIMDKDYTNEELSLLIKITPMIRI